jgi:hypothetical protein
MFLAKIKWHILRVQGIIPPFLPNELELNYELSPGAAYIAFKVRIIVHLALFA